MRVLGPSIPKGRPYKINIDGAVRQVLGGGQSRDPLWLVKLAPGPACPADNDLSLRHQLAHQLDKVKAEKLQQILLETCRVCLETAKDEGLQFTQAPGWISRINSSKLPN